MKNEKKNYIDAEELRNEVIKYHQSEKPTDELGNMILKMIDKIMSSGKFNRYPETIKDEMRSKAAFFCVRGLKHIDGSRTGRNIFNYLTTAIFTACLQSINKYHKDVQLKNKLMQTMIANLDQIPVEASEI